MGLSIVKLMGLHSAAAHSLSQFESVINFFSTDRSQSTRALCLPPYIVNFLPNRAYFFASTGYFREMNAHIRTHKSNTSRGLHISRAWLIGPRGYGMAVCARARCWIIIFSSKPQQQQRRREQKVLGFRRIVDAADLRGGKVVKGWG